MESNSEMIPHPGYQLVGFEEESDNPNVPLVVRQIAGAFYAAHERLTSVEDRAALCHLLCLENTDMVRLLALETSDSFSNLHAAAKEQFACDSQRMDAMHHEMTLSRQQIFERLSALDSGVQQRLFELVSMGNNSAQQMAGFAATTNARLDVTDARINRQDERIVEVQRAVVEKGLSVEKKTRVLVDDLSLATQRDQASMRTEFRTLVEDSAANVVRRLEMEQVAETRRLKDELQHAAEEQSSRFDKDIRNLRQISKRAVDDSSSAQAIAKRTEEDILTLQHEISTMGSVSRHEMSALRAEIAAGARASEEGVARIEALIEKSLQSAQHEREEARRFRKETERRLNDFDSRTAANENSIAEIRRAIQKLSNNTRASSPSPANNISPSPAPATAASTNLPAALPASVPSPETHVFASLPVSSPVIARARSTVQNRLASAPIPGAAGGVRFDDIENHHYDFLPPQDRDRVRSILRQIASPPQQKDVVELITKGRHWVRTDTVDAVMFTYPAMMLSLDHAYHFAYDGKHRSFLELITAVAEMFHSYISDAESLRLAHQRNLGAFNGLGHVGKYGAIHRKLVSENAQDVAEVSVCLRDHATTMKNLRLLQRATYATFSVSWKVFCEQAEEGFIENGEMREEYPKLVFPPLN